MVGATGGRLDWHIQDSVHKKWFVAALGWPPQYELFADLTAQPDQAAKCSSSMLRATVTIK